MHDGVNDPAAVPSPAQTGPAARWRAATLLGIGVGVGLALGVLLTVGVSATHTFLTPTLSVPSTRDSMQVLNELNELRLQVNQLNEEKKLQDQGKDDAMRRALATLAAAVRERASATTVAPSAEKPGGGMSGPPARRSSDPFAELDAEIKSLEQTQTVLNAILDLFLPAGKEPAKERPRVPDRPE
jgi:hypothetical protein